VNPFLLVLQAVLLPAPAIAADLTALQQTMLRNGFRI